MENAQEVLRDYERGYKETARRIRKKKIERCYAGIENSFKMAIQEDIWQDTN